MSMGHGGAIPETDAQRRPTAETADSDAAELLSAGRELIAEARRILADAPRDASGKPIEPVLYRSLLEAAPALGESSDDSARRFKRRLVALVPAAAGVALLGAGLAAITGGQTKHALTVRSQRPATAASVAPSVPTTVSGQASPAFEVPLSMSVPRLHSDATVAGEVYVQTSGPEAGLLDAPGDYHQLGWYRHGDSGALVLDGHVGYRSDPGPLAFIGSLTPGDAVTVSFPSGDRTFSVTVVGKALKGQLPQQYFSDRYDQDLMLITCDYTSPFTAGHFADNVYVVAAPKE